ncbi:MAG: hypothetical protein R6U61_06895 [Thermoplasmata archaeon]
MLDYLMSKIVWIIAAVVLTASVIGVYNWQRHSMEEVELEERAKGISEMVNRICTTDGEIKLLASSNESRDPDIYLEPSINGRVYQLQFTPSGFYLKQGDKIIWRDFVENVHMMNPALIGENDYSLVSQVDSIDHDLSISSGENFYIMSKGYNGVYEVFIYSEDSEGVVAETKTVGSVIADFFQVRPSKGNLSYNKTANDTFKGDITFQTDCLFLNNNTELPCPIPKVHLWNVSSENISDINITQMDEEHSRLQVHKNEKVHLKRQLLYIDGNFTAHRFIYTDQASVISPATRW